MTIRLFAGLAAIALCIPAAHAQQAMEDWQAIDAQTATVAAAMGRTAAPIDDLHVAEKEVDA